MSWPQVTIQIVTWNSRKYLPGCFQSIFNQTFKDFQVLVIDNNSEDGTVDFIKKNYSEVAVFRNNKNLGFAKANNQGIKLLHSPLVVLMNADVVLTADWLAKMVAAARDEKNRTVGSFCSRLLKMKVINLDAGDIERTDLVDSCGLTIHQNGQVKEIGSGRLAADFTKSGAVFGCSGALALYRREALESCLLANKYCPQGEYFDEDFFAYKEDVDLAWRLRLAGWDAYFVAEATAYHARALKDPGQMSWWRLIGEKIKRNKILEFYSYRNHFWLLLKNESAADFFRFFPKIFWFEFKKAVFALFFSWSNLRAIFVALGRTPKMWQKRKQIFKNAKIGKEEIRKWMN